MLKQRPVRLMEQIKTILEMKTGKSVRKMLLKSIIKNMLKNKGRNGLVGHIKIQKLKTEDRNFLMIFLL
jgi:hypothetical protein